MLLKATVRTSLEILLHAPTSPQALVNYSVGGTRPTTKVHRRLLLTCHAPRPAATDARLSADPSPFVARHFTIVSMLVVVPALIRRGQPAS